MDDMKIVDLTPENIGDYGVCGYKDSKKHIELMKKIEWFNKYYPMGLRIKALISRTGGYQGMIEYIPGEYAHRPVKAEGYLFIHCLFVGFKKEFKGKGYASFLIDETIREAGKSGAKGVAVVTRKGSFMAGDGIFIKNGFNVVDMAKPDFKLLIHKFDSASKEPGFIHDVTDNLKQYGRGLTIFRSPQCPYTEKNVNAIVESAGSLFNMEARVIELENHDMIQSLPCAFGTFCIIYNGEIISYHPISNTRFINIMRNIDR